jgi:hypothetical protein
MALGALAPLLHTQYGPVRAGAHCRAEQRNGIQEAAPDHGHHCIEFEVAVAVGNLHRDTVPDYLRTIHCQRLRHHGV